MVRSRAGCHFHDRFTSAVSERHREPGRVNSLNVMPVLFLAPAFLFFLVYVILPIFQSIYISFHEWDGLGEMTYVGAGNYVELLDDDRFYTSLKNNILWLVLYMLVVPVGLFVALFLNQTVTGIRIYKSLFFFLRHLADRRRAYFLVVLQPDFRRRRACLRIFRRRAAFDPWR